MSRWPTPWPLPALLTWGSAWLLFIGLRQVPISNLAALLLPCLFGTLASLWGGTWWRRILIAAGFPLSLLLLGGLHLPTWMWLLPLGLMLLVYPLNAWRDAPLFPTPRRALAALPEQVPLPLGAKVLDAGCGLGDGLIALRSVYPAAQFDGVEWSWLLRLTCAVRCPWAKVRRADMWSVDWSPYQLVYLFQRPESMARASEKALAELAPGAWLVSLEFPLVGVLPRAQLRTEGARVVWIYQVAPGWDIETNRNETN